MGAVLEDAAILGRRTAEMHRALASVHDDPDFAPVRFTPHYQRSIYQAMRTQQLDTFDRLRRETHHFPDADRQLAETLLDRRDELLMYFGY